MNRFSPGATICANCGKSQGEHVQEICPADLPQTGHLFQHKDGGIYRIVTLSQSTVDNSGWVVYEHEYPFPKKTWNRPLTEWTDDRFTRISHTRLWQIQKEKSVVEFQREITEARNKRKQAETIAKCEKQGHNWYVKTSCSSYFRQRCKHCGLEQTIDKD